MISHDSPEDIRERREARSMTAQRHQGSPQAGVSGKRCRIGNCDIKLSTTSLGLCGKHWAMVPEDLLHELTECRARGQRTTNVQLAIHQRLYEMEQYASA